MTRLHSTDLDELELLITSNITFINELSLSTEIVVESERMLTDVDLNDTPFVALTKQLNAKLWTGDKELVAGLQTKYFIDVLTTRELSDILDKLER